MSGRHLTPERKQRRLALWESGLDDAAIAAAEGVARVTITAWRQKNGLTANRGARKPKPPTEHVRKPEHEAKRITLRPCLRCRATVKSEGPHHRMCDDCRKAARDLPAECTVSL